MGFSNRSERTAAKKAAAEALGLSVKTVNRLGLCAEPLKSVQEREEKSRKAAEKRKKCEEMAKKVVNREVSAEKAAHFLGISRRQLDRYITKVPACSTK